MTDTRDTCSSRGAHSWLTPKVGEDSAVCAKCSYSVALSDIMVATHRSMANERFDEAIADYERRRRTQFPMG